MQLKKKFLIVQNMIRMRTVSCSQMTSFDYKWVITLTNISQL